MIAAVVGALLVAVPAPATDLDWICGTPGAGAMPLDRKFEEHLGCASVTMNRRGLVKASATSRPTFSFELGPSKTAIVRIDRISDGANSGVIACGPVENGKVYALPDTAQVSALQVLSVTIFDSVLGDAEKARMESLRTQREGAIVTAEFAAAEVYAQANLPKLRDELGRVATTFRTDAGFEQLNNSVATLGNIQDACRPGAVTGPLEEKKCAAAAPFGEPWTRKVEEALTRVEASAPDPSKVASLQSKLGLDWGEHEAKFAAAFKPRQPAFAPTQQAVAAAVKEPSAANAAIAAVATLRQALEAQLCKPAPPLPADEKHCAAVALAQASLLAVSGDLIALDRALLGDPVDRAVALATLAEAKAALPEKLLMGKDLDAHCDDLALITWLRDAPLRPVVRAEIPVLRGRDRLEIVSFGGGDTTLNPLWNHQNLGVLLVNAPNGIKLSTAIKRTAVASTSPVEILAKFLSIAVGAGTRSGGALDSTLCLNREATLVDAKTETLAEQTTRAIAFAPFSSDYRTGIAICSGAKCSSGADDEAVRNRLDISSRAIFGLTLMVEQSANALLNPRHAHLSKPRLEPVGGTLGPDQLFQLSYATDPKDFFATSVLLAVRWWNVAVGFGPAFIIGTNAALFSQWSARVMFSFVRGVFVTLGVGVRFVPTAFDYPADTVFSVPRTSGQDATPPSLRTRDTEQWLGGVGVALDLALLADAGAGLLKAIGATK